ncbi:hypothetical protein F4825DRAFT_456440 [Nemania diffusa]|nr:hypothetical protein F4825DRAFT_456440 [Nemania diffusa]
MSAPIIQEYLPEKATGNMVDYIIYVDPPNDPGSQDKAGQYREVIASLRRRLPAFMLNHTDSPGQDPGRPDFVD